MIKLVSFTGISGAGKTTLAKELLKWDSRFRLVTSHTTRAPRDSDLDGEYSYLDDRQFEELRARGQFLWSVSFAGFKYGTTKESVQNVFADDHSVGVMILVPQVIPVLLEYLTAEQQKSYLRFFLVSPGEQELHERLAKRGEDEGVIRGRLFVSSRWEHQARHSPFGFTFIHTHGQTVSETAVSMLGFFA